jgi:3',5'-cyclic AMP phosphodiesterase CpdA
MMQTRLVHFSDIHVSAYPLGFGFRDRLGKRMTGWVNLRVLGRGRRFRTARDILGVLGEELPQLAVDHIIFSGDATMLGFDSEYAEAVRLLNIASPSMPAGIAVPGNHDLYTQRALRQSLFEQYFELWQSGQRPEGHRYPFAQRVGDVWLIGLNSSRPTRWAWDASGRVGWAQRERLVELLAGLGPGLRILVTHYPLCMSDGRPEPRFHRLRDHEEMLRIARDGGIGLWLCGHRHVGYSFGPTDEVPFPVICAGSATQRNRWGYNLYTIETGRLVAQRRVFDESLNRYADADQWELDLRLAE